MPYRIKKQTRINGKPAKVGELVDLPHDDGLLLVRLGKAEEVEGKVETKITVSSSQAEVETEASAEASTESKPKRRGRPPKNANY